MNNLDPPKIRESLGVDCIRVRQPLGEFYVASIKSSDLLDLTWVDVRRIRGERGFETYLGIQRPLILKRVKEIAAYVNTVDACFPTAVILAVPGVCAEYDEANNRMTLNSYMTPEEGEEEIEFGQIAKVIDGQHRIEGLRGFKGKEFEVNVSIFIDMDIADQAHLFSTVNLAQNKVNKSLVYDLFDLARSRSPQKTCHNIAVTLDKHEKSPFFERIKRLGVATEGRFNETITQAAFIQSLLGYISPNPLEDRNLYMRGRKPELAGAPDLERMIFRNMFIEERDLDIGDIVWNYFDSIQQHWPQAWNYAGRGRILNRTNGFKGCMRFLRPAYLYLTSPGGVPTTEDFLSVIQRIDMSDDDFNTDKFKPGSTGEVALYRALLEMSGLEG